MVAGSGEAEACPSRAWLCIEGQERDMGAKVKLGVGVV